LTEANIDVDALNQRIAQADQQLQAMQNLREQLSQRESDAATLRQALTTAEVRLDERLSRDAEIQRELSNLRQQLDRELHLKGELDREYHRLREQHVQTEKRAEEREALLKQSQERLSAEFRLVSDKLLKEHGATFAKQNLEQVSGVLNPLKEKLGEFQTSLNAARLETAKERAGLEQHIKQMMQTGLTMSEEAKGLAEALRGSSKIQGTWGEMVLSRVLESSGLREGHEFQAQISQRGDEGQRQQPDVVIMTPNGSRIVVDAKVSLTAYQDYVKAGEDEMARRAAAQRHLTSVREHIRRLGNKGYQRAQSDSPDFVIMFLPIEPALALAVEQDDGLIQKALEQNVGLATPTTLLLALRTVASLWQVENRSKNVEKIAGRAGLLYDKFVGFTEDMLKLGKQLETAQGSYEAALNKLSTGRGNLVTQAEVLKKLGAKSSKSLPETLQPEEEEIAAEAPTEEGDGEAGLASEDEPQVFLPKVSSGPA